MSSTLRDLFEECTATDAKNWPLILAKCSTYDIRARLLSMLEVESQTCLKFTKLVQDFSDRSFRSHYFFDPGTDLGDFIVVEKLGDGGFGAVYLAKQKSIDRLVALKISKTVNDHEANLLAKLNHPNIVKIFSVTSIRHGEDSFFVICMEFIPGKNLRQFMRERANDTYSRPENTGLVLKLFEDISAALAYAHKQEVLHLDIKPENILVNADGRFLLADFNVSYFAKESDAKVLGGSFNYMAPEQLQLMGKAASGIKPAHDETPTITEAADIFSIGVVGRELAQELGVFDQIEIQVLCDKAMSPLPTDRFHTAKDLEKISRFKRSSYQGLNMDQKSKLQSLIVRHPWIAVYIAILGTNGFASIIQVQYNYLYILEGLSPDARKNFFDFLAPVNLVLFSIGFLFIRFNFIPLIDGLKASVNDQATIKNAFDTFKNAMMRISFVMFLLWSTGFVCFSKAISFMEQPQEIRVHFILSFVISLLVSLSLSRLLVSYLGLGTFYPVMLAKSLDIYSNKQLPRISGLRYTSGIVLMSSALFVLFLGSDTGAYPKEILVCCFVVAGVLAFIWGVEISQRVNNLWRVIAPSE